MARTPLAALGEEQLCRVFARLVGYAAGEEPIGQRVMGLRLAAQVRAVLANHSEP